MPNIDSERHEERPVTQRDYVAVETAFEAIPHGPTRRALLDRAGKALAIAGGGALLAGATPAFAGGSVSQQADSIHHIKRVLATFETFGVTFLTEVVRRAPGTPSAKFLPVLKSANTSEFLHLRALERHDAESFTSHIWIPEALFGGGGAALFKNIETDETIEVSAYLVGVTSFARAGDTYGARLCAEALGTEAVHRALARDAQLQLGVPLSHAPNDHGFEAFQYRTGSDALRALEAVGVGFGTKGSKPGRFYNFPGDPRQSGAGLPVTSEVPR